MPLLCVAGSLPRPLAPLRRRPKLCVLTIKIKVILPLHALLCQYDYCVHSYGLYTYGLCSCDLYIVVAYKGMACVVMAYLVMAYIVMAHVVGLYRPTARECGALVRVVWARFAYGWV